MTSLVFIRSVLVVFLLLALRTAAPAASYYVTPAGGGDYGGTNWANAFSNVQAAVNAAGADVVCLKCGTYSNASQIAISNFAGLAIRGGYAGNEAGGLPGDLTNVPSILTRTNSAVMRIMYAVNSTVTLDRVTVTGGYLTNTGDCGAGLHLTNCNATITNCVIANNTIDSAVSDISRGGLGIYFAGAGRTLELNGCVISNNIMTAGGRYLTGGGVYFTGAYLYVYNSAIITNGRSSAAFPMYGGGIYCSASSNVVVSSSVFRANMSKGMSAYGGAIHIGGACNATLDGSEFSANNAYGSGSLLDDALGAAVYANNAGVLQVNACQFSNNFTSSDGDTEVGGAIYRTGGSNTYISACAFVTNRLTGPLLVSASLYRRGGAVALDNTSATIVGCDFIGNYLLCSGGTGTWARGGGAIYVESGVLAMSSNVFTGNYVNFTEGAVSNRGGNALFLAGGAVTAAFSHCTFQSGADGGMDCEAVRVVGATLAMTNCLIAGTELDGLRMSNGWARLVNCTFADNGGWGFRCDGGTGTVLNSIAWGNFSGGFPSNAAVIVSNSCSQNPVVGANNTTNDPLFIYDYYLSQSGLPAQTNDSPCLNAGSGAPADYGLNIRTTRTDGGVDTNANVNMGFHYLAGMSNQTYCSNSTLYVSAGAGNDTNSGLTVGNPLKTLTAALGRIRRDGTIYAAAGTYNAATNGEVFPLIVQTPNLTIIGTNRDATVVDANSTGRVLNALSKGNIRLASLTFKNGNISSGSGAGMRFLCSGVTLTNCVVKDNNISSEVSDSFRKAVGIYFDGAGRTLELNNCVISNNIMTGGGRYLTGGGVYFNGAYLYVVNSAIITNGRSSAQFPMSGGGIYCSASSNVVVSNSIFRANMSKGALAYGGAIHIGGGCNATLVGSEFSANNTYVSYSMFDDTAGAAVYATNAGMLQVNSCQFSNNFTSSDGDIEIGGAIYRTGGSNTYISACTFVTNRLTGPALTAAYLYRRGGAVALVNSPATIIGCDFIGNYLLCSGGTGTWARGGGAIYAESCVLTLASNTFTRNYASFAEGGILNRGGGALYLAGGTTAAVSHCVFRDTSTNTEAIRVSGATLMMTNSLVAAGANSGLGIADGTATVVNCTLANNGGWGILNAGTLALKNSIVWGNVAGIAANAATAVTYSDVQGGVLPGAGNMSADPLFVDAAGGDYHVWSAGGSWRGGGAWTNDAQTSPCVDAGDPASPCTLEPKPNRGRVNLGVYGNTPEASRSVPGTVLRLR